MLPKKWLENILKIAHAGDKANLSIYLDIYIFLLTLWLKLISTFQYTKFTNI